MRASIICAVRKGETLNVLTQTEPFELALGIRRWTRYTYLDACSKLVYTTEHSLYWCSTILDVIALQLASNQLATSSALSVHEARSFVTLHNFWWSSALDCAPKRQNASQRIARGLQNLLWTTQRCCPFTAAEYAVKVRAFVLDAYMRHWHLRAYNYLTHVCVIGNWTVKRQFM